jgi:hypothetical protein
MKNLITTLLFSMFFMVVIAQSWAPLGAKWSYGISFSTSSNINFVEWISTKDTTVSARACKVVKRKGEEVAGDHMNQFVTYEENGIVYLSLDNQFTVLYDFSKNTGDSWSIMKGNCGIIVRVDSTTVTTINNLSKKVQYVSSTNGAFNGKIIEGIGHSIQPFPSFDYTCTSIVYDMNFYNGLRCYSDVNLGFFETGISYSCDYQSLEGLAEINLNTTQKVDYKIFTLLGQQVKSGSIIGDEFNQLKEQLSNGTYIIHVYNKDTVLIKRFVVEK